MLAIKLACLLSLFGLAYSSCSGDSYANRVLRVSGDWSSAPLWSATEPRGLMTLDPVTCLYTVIVTNLTPNTVYQWKVAVDNNWKENWGCFGMNGPNCLFVSNSEGSVRFLFKPSTNPPQLFTDHVVDAISTTTATLTTSQATSSTSIGTTYSTTSASLSTTTTTSTTGQSISTSSPSPSSTSAPVIIIDQSANPIKPCNRTSCPDCSSNMFAARLVRATGDWAIDSGSSSNWFEHEPNGLMTYDLNTCTYTHILTNLKPNYQYKWKIVIDNTWKENYGCTGLSAADCSFKTNSAGAIRFMVKASTNPPQLSTDFNIGECGNNICEPGETCSTCAEDCGECIFECGNGVCEEGETFLNCPSDCVNELPGCERFNDESCKSGSQIAANEGSSKRRWQTPRPGADKYQPSYQHMHVLVGYADIKYTSSARTEADVCIQATHRHKVELKYFFDGVEQSSPCRHFTQSFKSKVSLQVVGSDGSSLKLASISLKWNNQVIKHRDGDYRNGQKGAVPEMFGWPHRDVEKECELLAKAGYLGVKLFPVHEQLMSYQPFENSMNPWYFMYQPVSYNLDGRAGTREELESLIKTCRSLGLRVYVDAILNHFSGAGNDMNEHRNPGAGCTRWGNKTTSAPIERQSPFYTHAYTYQYNPNTGEPPSQEFPGAAIGPEDFHCERSLGSWSDLFILNNGWLVGLTDLDTSKDNVRERQAAYLVEMLSMGVSGFRIDAAKHVSPEDLAAIFKKVQVKMGGQFPDDFIVWLEILTGGEAGLLWGGPSWYGSSFENMLKSQLGSYSEVEKIKMWDGLYPKEPYNNPSISQKRVVIQNDDHDQQMPGSSSRDMAGEGCVLVKNCPENDHRNFEIRLFKNPNGVHSNNDDWPIRFILSSYYHTHDPLGIPDGKSDCSLCKVTCESCKTVPYMPAYEPGVCAYKGQGYTRVHRDLAIINAMRSWIHLGPISGSDIGLPGC